jgi:transposase
MYAIANALDGLSRAEAARLAGMERQALHDAVLRYNAEGLAGLHDRPKGRPRRRLTGDEEAEHPAGARSRTGRVLRLDACRSLPLARDALRQDLSPVEHDAGA